jgi:hypothetical protein
LTDTPLRCEPGYSGSSVAECAPYSKFVEFHSLDFSITQAIESPPIGFAEFRPHFIQYFLSHIDFYMAKLNFLMSKWDLMMIGHSYASSIVTATYSQTSEKLKTLYESLSGSAWVSENEGSFDATTRHWYTANDSEGIVSSGPMFHHEEIDFEEYSPSPPTFHHFDFSSDDDSGVSQPIADAAWEEAVEDMFRRKRMLARARRGRFLWKRRKAQSRNRKPREIATRLVELEEESGHW